MKKILIARKKMTDARAYHYITTYAKSHKCSVEQAAKELKNLFGREG